jgi:hypothetical protein
MDGRNMRVKIARAHPFVSTALSGEAAKYAVAAPGAVMTN